MYQKDYILRMLEMLADMISSILGYIKNGKFKRASQAIENAYQTMLKEDASFFQNIPVDQLTSRLIQKHHYTNGHLEILAELFLAEAELKFAKDKKAKSIELYSRSIILFDFLEKATKIYSEERKSKTNTIRKKITEIEQSLL